MNIHVRNTYGCHPSSRATTPEVCHERRTGTAPTSATLPRLPTADSDEGPHHRWVAPSRTRGVLAPRDVRLPIGHRHQGGGRHLRGLDPFAPDRPPAGRQGQIHG